MRLGAFSAELKQKNVTGNGFDIKLQKEEAQVSTAYTAEQVAFIAIETGTTANLEVALTGRVFDETESEFSFANTFDDIPVLIADMQSNFGNDTAALRFGNLTATSTRLKVQEEKSWDSELGHTNEVIGILALEEGLIL